jgi:hypothetical protein
MENDWHPCMQKAVLFIIDNIYGGLCKKKHYCFLNFVGEILRAIPCYVTISHFADKLAASNWLPKERELFDYQTVTHRS